MGSASSTRPPQASRDRERVAETEPAGNDRTLTARRISVVMATFNGSRFIREQVESLAAQTLLPAELVVSDDGSTDDTVAIVEAFASTALFPVRIHRNSERLGYGGNFLTAAALATGEFIAFCDQDDVWRPEKLRAAQQALDAAGASLFVHAADVIDDTGTRFGSFDQGIGRAEDVAPLRLDPWGVFYGFSMVFRRELLQIVDVSRRGAHTFEHDRALSHDLWIYFLATSLGTIRLDPRRLVGYRQHGANQTPHVLSRPVLALTSRLGRAFDLKLARNAIARDRADLFHSIESVDPAVQRRLSQAALYWDRIASLEDLRARVYGRGPRRGRAAAWFRLARVGAYRRVTRRGLGRGLALKDAVAGVLDLRRKANRA